MPRASASLALNAFVALVAAIAIDATLASAQDVGAFVFPKVTPTEIKVGTEVTARVEISNYLVVEKTQNGWLWVQCKDLLAPGEEGKRGWIEAAKVDDLETQIKYFESKAALNNSGAVYFLAGAVASLPDDPIHQRRAVDYFSRAIQLQPKSAYNYQRRAASFVALAQYDDALKDLEQAAAIDPTDQHIAKLLEMVKHLVGNIGISSSGPTSSLSIPGFGTPDTPLDAPTGSLSGPFAWPPALDPDVPRSALDPTMPAAPFDPSIINPEPTASLLVGPTPIDSPDVRVSSALTEAGIDYTVQDGGTYRVNLNFEGGRSQTAFVISKTEKLGDFEIREVWSPIGTADEAGFSQETANELLRVGAARKIGSVEVATLNGKPTAYFTAKVPADLSASRLAEIIRGVASIADDYENSLFHVDGY